MKLTTKATFCLAILWFSLSSTIKDPSDPPMGNTGAPGETTCAQTGCHSGGVYTGTVALTGVPDTVTANTSYTLTLTNTSNAPRAGFQLVCLDSTVTPQHFRANTPYQWLRHQPQHIMEILLNLSRRHFFNFRFLIASLHVFPKIDSRYCQ